MASLILAIEAAAGVPLPPAGYVAEFIDSADGVPKYKDAAGNVFVKVGPKGDTGNSLARPLNASLTSSAGAVVIDLSLGKEVYYITLTENTTISFTNLPAAGYVAEGRIRIKQHASAAKTCVFSGASVKPSWWSVSSVLGSTEEVGFSVDPSNNIDLFPSGLR